MTARRTDELRRRWGRHARRGLAVSVLFHVLLVLAIRDQRVPDSPFAAAGPREHDDRAAAGGGVEVIAIRVPPPDRPVTPIPIPEPVIEDEPEPEPEPEPEIEPPEIAVVAEAALPAAPGMEPGPVEGPGRPEGDGRGDAGTAAEGRFRVVPPSPRGLILPPAERPRRVRGQEVEVWVFVTETGRVVPDSTRLRPGTGDSRFDSRLKRQAAEWLFEPARRGGRPVAEWYRYVIGL